MVIMIHLSQFCFLHVFISEIPFTFLVWHSGNRVSQVLGACVTCSGHTPVSRETDLIYNIIVSVQHSERPCGGWFDQI